MNTKTKSGGAKRVADAPAVDPRKGTNDGPADKAPAAAKRARVKDDEKVTVMIPAPFKLNLGENGGIVPYDSGTQEMPLSHALHPYSKDNGVEIYKG